MAVVGECNIWIHINKKKGPDVNKHLQIRYQRASVDHLALDLELSTGRSKDKAGRRFLNNSISHLARQQPPFTGQLNDDNLCSQDYIKNAVTI
jgi:hypothetical protein